ATMTSAKPIVVYFHRYPIEFESEQFPATKTLLNLLSNDFEVVYFSMAASLNDKKLRANARFEEIPLKINRFQSRDKWLKTILY
ncbi:MAG: hypothetical protein ABJC04_08885, partial [Verrucomicrobiota bacterium]